MPRNPEEWDAFDAQQSEELQRRAANALRHPEPAVPEVPFVLSGVEPVRRLPPDAVELPRSWHFSAEPQRALRIPAAQGDENVVACMACGGPLLHRPRGTDALMKWYHLPCPTTRRTA